VIGAWRREILAVVAALSMGMASARAQDGVEAGLAAWKDAACGSCHGVFAQGGGGGEQPEGPSLRRTSLDKANSAETIRCGRPGTQMPYFQRGAYSAQACFGMPLSAAPAEVAPGASLYSAAEIDTLVEYLTARIVGKSQTITRAECAAYYANANHPRCAEYR
jgi:mono/diheme cytochrome c family protein